MSSYYHYFSFGLGRYADRLLIRIRERVFGTFLEAFSPSANHSVLDIGISEDDHISSNYLEKMYLHPERIIGLSREPYPSLKAQFPAIKLVCGDGRALPFADDSIDFVYSHAVIEHTGSRARQQQFLSEALRVSRKGVLLTTPNRWHPIETHIGLPLIHYLPAWLFRRICRALGKEMYATEETLNLLSKNDLVVLIRSLPRPPRSYRWSKIFWLGFTSNIVLIIRKPARSTAGRRRES